MQKFIVATPHPDDIDGESGRIEIYGPFDDKHEAARFRIFFFKEIMAGIGSEDSIQVRRYQDPKVLGFKLKRRPLSPEDKLIRIAKLIGADPPVEWHGWHGVYHWIGEREKAGSYIMTIAYSTGSIGFDYAKILGVHREGEKGSVQTDAKNQAWNSENVESKVFRPKKPSEDPSIRFAQELQWLRMKIKMKKKIKAPISPV